LQSGGSVDIVLPTAPSLGRPSSMNHHPTQAQLDALLAYELTCAQIEALRCLRAICQDLSDPKEARLAAIAILKFRLAAKQVTPPQPTSDPTSPQAFPRPDADAALDSDLSGG
jgi:hypothetical protein